MSRGKGKGRMRKEGKGEGREGKMRDEEFFSDLFAKPEPLSYDYHPSDRVLQAYLKGRLHDEWQIDEEFLPRLRQADLDGEWGLSEVSLHLLTCSPCCERIARMRAAELAQMERARTRDRARGRGRGWLAQLWERLSGVASSLARPWPTRRVAGHMANLITSGLSPFMLDLSVGTRYVPSASLSLLHQHARGGLEFQGGALPLELEGRLPPEGEPDY